MYFWYFQHSGRAVQCVQCPYPCACCFKSWWRMSSCYGNRAYMIKLLMIICKKKKSKRCLKQFFLFKGKLDLKTFFFVLMGESEILDILFMKQTGQWIKEKAFSLLFPHIKCASGGGRWKEVEMGLGRIFKPSTNWDMDYTKELLFNISKII